MPKFWLPTESERHNSFMLNEDVWFRVYQPLLLAMANTKFGRDLLCIPQDYPRIIKMTKNSVHSLISDDGVTAKVHFDVRIGAKWANVVRYRFNQFQSYARYFDFRASLPIQAQAGVSSLTSKRLSLMMATITARPDPSPETTTVDGWVNSDRNGGANWTNSRNLATGASANDSGTGLTCHVGRENGAGEYNIFRNFLLFDTSSIGAGVVSAASVSVTSSGSTQNNDNDGNDYLGICTSSPASNTAIVTADFDQITFTEQHDAGERKDWSSMNTASTVGTLNLNATGIGNINTSGVTKFSALEGHDIQNDPYAGSINSSTNINFYAAEETGTGNDPVLSGTYSIPSVLLGIERTPIRGVMRGTMRP